MSITGQQAGEGGKNRGGASYPNQLFIGQKPGEGGNGEPQPLGVFPDTGEQITLRNGRFGPYVQLGDGEKPKRSSLPKGSDPSNVELELAIKLLSLPREVGKHPESGEPITANFGRYGPYVAHNGQYASLETPEDVFNIGLNHAVTVLAEKRRAASCAADPNR